MIAPSRALHRLSISEKSQWRNMLRVLRPTRLPFLKEQAKRNILGGNAARLFWLDTKVVKRVGWVERSETHRLFARESAGGFRFALPTLR